MLLLVSRFSLHASAGKSYEHRLIGFNNDPATKFRDVSQILRETIARLKKRRGKP